MTRAEINEKENRRTIEKTGKTKSWFSEKINKIVKPLARLTKKKERRNKLPISGIKQGVAPQTLQTSKGNKRILRTSYTYKYDHTDEMD